jgi:HTH-type transcriptional regulator, sugar sensing transcriptional regulator
MDESLINIFKQSGLSDKEAKVYLALLEAGVGTVFKIAQVTKIKRPSVYVVLESLTNKGFATKIPNRKTSTYSPGDPAILAAQLSTTAKNFRELLPYLQTLMSRLPNRPKISFYDTEEAVWNIYKETSQHNDVSLISSYARLGEYFPRATEEWLRNCEKGIYKLKDWRHIISDDPKDLEIGKRLLKLGQNVRCISGGDIHAIDLALYGNKFSITLIDKEPIIVVLESETLKRSMSAIFEIIWKAAKTIK